MHGLPDDAPDGGPATYSSVPALERIATLLRHIDEQLSTLRSETSTDRVLSVIEEVPKLGQVLGPLEQVLGQAVRRLGVKPEAVNVRRRMHGALNILWADLVDMSPQRLRSQWGAKDVPEEWAELHQRLLATVEAALVALGDHPEPPEHSASS